MQPFTNLPCFQAITHLKQLGRPRQSRLIWFQFSSNLNAMQVKKYSGIFIRTFNPHSPWHSLLCFHEPYPRAARWILLSSREPHVLWDSAIELDWIHARSAQLFKSKFMAPSSLLKKMHLWSWTDWVMHKFLLIHKGSKSNSSIITCSDPFVCEVSPPSLPVVLQNH